MEPITVAAAVVTLLAPYVRKTAEEFAGEVGKSVFEKTKELWSRVVGALRSDPEASAIVSRFESKPDSYATALTDLLAEKLSDQPKLLANLSAEIESIKNQAPDLEIVQKVKRAEQMVGLDSDTIEGGKISIKQEGEEFTNVTGAKIRNIGRLK